MCGFRGSPDNASRWTGVRRYGAVAVLAGIGMRGSVYRTPSGSWEYRFDLEPDAMTGRRRFATRAGFRTKSEAQDALREDISASVRARRVKHSRRTVREFLDEWHRAVRPSLRASTWVNYRDYLD